MKLFKLAKTFKNDESGAVTVDWVVLTAALVGLGLLVIQAIAPSINNAATDIQTDLDNAGSVQLDGSVGGGAATE